MSERFPGGLRCAVCHREIEEYTEYLTGFVDDLPVVVLVCFDCEEEMLHDPS